MTPTATAIQEGTESRRFGGFGGFRGVPDSRQAGPSRHFRQRGPNPDREPPRNLPAEAEDLTRPTIIDRLLLVAGILAAMALVISLMEMNW
jgi:hypothetical protein